MGEVSSWLEEALKLLEKRRKTVAGLRLVVEVEPTKVSTVASELRRRGIKVVGSVENFIFVDVKEPAQIEEVARIPGVKYVSYEKKFWPMAHGIDELFKRIAIATDPLLKKLSQPDLERLGFHFKPAAEIPNPIKAAIENIDTFVKAVTNPQFGVKFFAENVRWNFPFGPPVVARADWRLVTYTRELLGVPKDNRLRRTYVGIIDTGPRYGPGIGSPLETKCISLAMPPEPPIDTMSHGSWCQACAYGRPALTRYGNFYPVANAPKVLHVKVFSAFGPCSSQQIMKAMEICAKNGCKVVSMSLGGTLTESVENDPECKLVDTLYRKYGTIWVIAAGNEDGSFEIGSPGAALKALTVAACDWKKKYHTSSYSSRGWQGKYYKKHKDEFEKHYSKYRDEFLKPDCGGIGGDRDSQVVSACSPWYDSVYDFVPDGWDLMIGTSMATPHIAGLVALAIDRGILPQNVDKIKDILRSTTDNWIFDGEIMDGKSVNQGWGVFHWSRLRE